MMNGIDNANIDDTCNSSPPLYYFLLGFDIAAKRHVWNSNTVHETCRYATINHSHQSLIKGVVVLAAIVAPAPAPTPGVGVVVVSSGLLLWLLLLLLC